ncbi:MAG TPA: alpha-L-fucosidase [Lacunisphaera sp.]
MLFKSSFRLPPLGVLSALVFSVSRLLAYDLPDLDPVPTPPTPQAPGTVAMGNPANFAEVQMDFPIEGGPFSPTWSSILANYPTKDSAWLRQAKFGIWVHFGPQSVGQSGDWYARRMYIEGQTAYNNHIRDFGHPSTVGYKDLVRTWNPTALDPVALTNAYYNAGARFVLVQGVHHDQYDNWNSKYQPWNSMNLAPKRDFLGEWKAALRAKGMRFGAAFHHEYTWWWWQSAYRADTTTNQGKQGVPYDGNLTTDPNTALGMGQWWEGMDLRKLYTINLREYIGIANAMDQTGWALNQGIFVNHLEFAHWYATWWALRILDVIENYDPDFIYTDGNSTQPFSGYKSGSGYKCDAMQRVLAHYYNRTLERRGTVDTFGIVKFNPNPRGVVNTFEASYPADIKTDQPWTGDAAVGDWYYNTGFSYDPGMVVRYLLECVSRDGAATINIALRPDGSLDPGSVTQLQAIGNWMTINGIGIYGSRAWNLWGEGPNKLPTGNLTATQANKVFTNADFRYTVGADGYLYAYCMTVPVGGAQLTLTALGTGDGNLAGPITSVELLGSSSTLTWSQTATDLNITCPASMSSFKIGVGFKIGPASIVRPPTPTDVYAHSAANGVALQWSSSLISATFTVKRATDPAGPFTPVASGITTQTYTDTTAQTGNIYYYVVTATQGTAVSSDSVMVAGILAGSSSWLGQDVGAVGTNGEFAKSGNRIVISGSGADIWGTADEFYYACRKLNGDGSITARITSQQNTAAWAKAGLMIRESLNANSAYVINYMSPSNGIALQRRASNGGSASGVANPTGLKPPYWLRLTRSGNTFTADRSADGTTWTTVGTTSVTMASSVYVGLAASSVNDGTLMQAAFDQVSVTGQTNPDAPDALTATAGDGKVNLSWPASSGATSYTVKRATTGGGPYTDVATGLTGTTYADSTVTNGTTYYYVVTATNSVGASGPSIEANALPVDARQAWRLANFGQVANTGNAANTADPDNDGRSNLMEYAVGSDPKQSDGATSGVPGKTGDGLRLTFTFSRIADPALTYTVEAADSPDQAVWPAIWTSTGASNVGGSVTVPDTELISDHPRRFLRLKVSL